MCRIEDNLKRFKASRVCRQDNRAVTAEHGVEGTMPDEQVYFKDANWFGPNASDRENIKRTIAREIEMTYHFSQDGIYWEDYRIAYEPEIMDAQFYYNPNCYDDNWII